jgi:hypothetical protein
MLIHYELNYQHDQIKGRMAGKYNTPGGDEKCIHNFEKGRDHLVDLGVDTRIILKWILERNMVRGCRLDSAVSGQVQ